jgi:hypothetical protein
LKYGKLNNSGINESGLTKLSSKQEQGIIYESGGAYTSRSNNEYASKIELKDMSINMA